MESNRERETIRRLACSAVVLVLVYSLAYLRVDVAAGQNSAAVNNPPSPPVLQFPTNGAMDTNLQVFFYWFASDPDGDEVECDLYFGTESPPPLLRSDMTFTLTRSPPLQVATTYHWRVVVRDEHGAETVGPEWTFATKATNTPPETPHNPYPGNNSTGAWIFGSLNWTSDDPDGFDLTYDVYFGTVSPPPFVGAIAHDGAEGRFPYASLAFLTTYYWRIVTRDPQGAETSGSTWTFTTKDNTGPDPPSYPNPPHNGLTSNSPEMTWVCQDPDRQPITYDVYLGQTVSPPLIAASLTTPSFQAPDLIPGVTYYWRVVASDGFLPSEGPLWSFSTRLPGDVVADNQLTSDDAACAMQIYMWNPECGGVDGARVADANCDDSVTPGDARCIHREALELGCEICDEAIPSSVPAEKTAISPAVSVSQWYFDGTVLIVRLAVSGVTSLNAFGFYSVANPALPLLQALRRGASSDFDVLEHRQVDPTHSVIGAYQLNDGAMEPDAEFIELRFDASGELPEYLIIDGFLDDLAGAPAVVMPLGGTVDVEHPPSGPALYQNYPNPFNPLTTIEYVLPFSPRAINVNLSIVDISGRVVRTVVDELQTGGSYRVTWDGTNDRGETVASGVYFYVLDVGTMRMTKKLALLK